MTDYDIKSTHELIKEINQKSSGIHSHLNAIYGKLEDIAPWQERQYDRLNQIDANLYQIGGDVRFLANRGNAHPGIFFVLLAILLVLCDVHYGLFDYLKAVAQIFLE